MNIRNAFSRIKDAPCAVAAAAATALASGGASAQTVGALSEGVTEQFGAIGKLVMGGSFVAGIVMVAGGLMKLKQAVDSQGQQVKYGDGLWRLGLGAGLVGLPAVTGVMGESIGLDNDATLAVTTGGLN